MATVTLHRASRFKDAIDKNLKSNIPLKVTSRVSVFTTDMKGIIEGHKKGFAEAYTRVATLLKWRAVLRSACDVANAKCGISALLAEKAELDARIAILEKLPGVAPEVQAQPEDEMAMYRRRGQKAVTVPALLDMDAVLATASATREKFAAADGSIASEIEFSAVDADAARGYKTSLIEARRGLDQISDKLRSINAASTVELPDEMINWLTDNEVV
jgi:hypothetical protein